MRIVFAGTPEFAVPCLDALIKGGNPPVAVYTQPDRPSGRGRRLEPSPVKKRALEAGIEVRQPATLRGADAAPALQALQPDLLIVVAYGLLLPAKVLAVPHLGCWNVHASLLPRWRGAAPIQRAIEAGDEETGVDLMQMEKGLDTGPLLLRLKTPIGRDETAGELHHRLAALGAEVLGDALGLLRAGLVPQPRAQPEVGVTYAKKLEKSEARLDWSQDAETLSRRVRAFSPWPIAEADIGGERLRIHRAQAIPYSGDAAPGSMLTSAAQGLAVVCASGALQLLQVQRDGGRPMGARDYLNARPALPQ